MRNPRPENFDPKVRKRQPDTVNMTGVVPLETPSSPPAKSSTPPLTEPPEDTSVVSRYRGSMVSSKHETTIFNAQTNPIEWVRKAVKEFGKEAATHRFTQAEKRAIAEVVFTYRNQGVRTSENELARIAINYLICDYQLNGQSSVLHQVLQSLNE
jgi:hypothetical protein